VVMSCRRTIVERGSIPDDILNRYEQERTGIGGARGAAWAALNAVTEHADHRAGGRRVDARAERDGRPGPWQRTWHWTAAVQEPVEACSVRVR
jgi:hypothetical protein